MNDINIKPLTNGYSTTVSFDVIAITDSECAIILGQIHFWLQLKEHHNDTRFFKDGRYWVYNSVHKWQETFPCFSAIMIRRKLEKMREMGILITGNFNTMKGDRTLWYTIDYERLNTLIDEYKDTIRSKRTNALDQNEQMDLIKMNQPLPKNTTKNNNKEYILNGALDNARCCSELNPKDVDAIHKDVSYPKDVINYDILKKQISKSLDHNDIYDSYSRTEITNIIVYFYHRYRDYFGVEHPCISQSCMDNVVCDLLADPSGVLDISTEIYAPLIDQYFETELSCDYRIMHFMSGQIREFRNYETGGV